MRFPLLWISVAAVPMIAGLAVPARQAAVQKTALVTANATVKATRLETAEGGKVLLTPWMR